MGLHTAAMVALQCRSLVLALVWLLVQLAHLVLPYALYYVADPTGGIEHDFFFFWSQVPRAVAPILGPDSRSFVPSASRRPSGPFRPP